MKRDIVNQLTKASQIAWEKYVIFPTNENRDRFEVIDDELRIELEFDRNTKFNNIRNCSDNCTDNCLCNS